VKGRRTPPLADRVVIEEAARAILSRPGLWILRIEHDDWCRFFTTGDPDSCNCNPDQRLVHVGDELEQEARGR
jgi:hypothetical protein